MNQEFIEQILNNGVCWIILLVAFACYQQLFSSWFKSKNDLSKDLIPTLITALPLLGLLGTIMGLLESFSALQAGATGTVLFSKGIGDALFTTQLGLLCAVPAWAIHTSLVSRLKRKELAHGK